MIRDKTLLRGIVLCLCACVGAAVFASPVDLVPRATGVAVGKLQSIGRSGDKAILSFNLSTQIAGEAPTGVVDFALNNANVSDLDLRFAGLTYIVLVSKSETSGWQLVVDEKNTSLVPQSLVPVFEDLPFEQWVRDGRFAVRGELARFLLWVIERRPDSGKAFGLLLDLLSGPPINNDFVSDKLFSLSNGGNTKVQGMAVAALLHANDPRGLERLYLAIAGGETELLDQEVVSYSLRRIDPTQHGLGTVLKHLLEAKPPRFRRGVALLMARTHTRDLAQTFVSLLDDPDPEMVSYAVGGLAMFANGVPPGKLEPGTGPAPYRTDETIAHSVMSVDAIVKRRDYYVDFWKMWWERHAAEILKDEAGIGLNP